MGRGARGDAGAGGAGGSRGGVVGSKTVVDGGAGDSVARESEGFGKRNRSGPARLDELLPYMRFVSLSFTLPTPPLFIARTRPVHNINMLHLWPHLLHRVREFLRCRTRRKNSVLLDALINWLVRHAGYRVQIGRAHV